MPPALFLQSEVENPYVLYEKMLMNNPVYWDEANQLWAVFSFSACKTVLTNAAAHIPAINQNNKDQLNEYALLITKHLARLNNEVQHAIAREVAMLLFQKIKTVSINGIVEKLLVNHNKHVETDFVNTICKRLPTEIILKSFDFDDEEANFISGKMESVVKIMAAVKNAEAVKQINEIAKEIYVITQKHLLVTGVHYSIIKSLQDKYKIEPDELVAACTSNLIGLFIQGYDAGRGILSNSLLQILYNEIIPGTADKSFIGKSVIETLRFDPPVQNTRRIAVNTILINDKEIKKDQTILVVLAAANRDSKKFNHPDKYNIERSNNNEHLTFGVGHHECVASHLSVKIATDTLTYLFAQYKNIKLLEKKIEYEPVINVRLPKKIMIDLH